MKLPRKNEIWVRENEKGVPYFFLVTDVYKKKKDDYEIHDDKWNGARIGQIFIYGVNERVGVATSHRSKLEEFLTDFKFYRKALICSCHYCNEIHFPSNLVG
jgi:hypothetical protein